MGQGIVGRVVPQWYQQTKAPRQVRRLVWPRDPNPVGQSKSGGRARGALPAGRRHVPAAARALTPPPSTPCRL